MVVVIALLVAAFVFLVAAALAWPTERPPVETVVEPRWIDPDFWSDHVDERNGTVFARVGWELETEQAEDGPARTAAFALHRLVDVCEQLDVAPAGALTVERQADEALDFAHTTEYILRLEVDRAAIANARAWVLQPTPSRPDPSLTERVAS